jgi:hypothetical protein
MNIDPEKFGRIVGAALLHNNCIYIGKEGHHTIFTMEPLGVLRCAKQGFVTEYGYFVDREIGLYIATYFNQINVKYNPKNKLVSEDLKKDDIKILKYIKEYSYKEN